MRCTSNYLRTHALPEALPSWLRLLVASFGCSSARGVCRHLGFALDGRVVVTFLVAFAALLVARRTSVGGIRVRTAAMAALATLVAAAWGVFEGGAAIVLSAPMSTVKLQRLPRFVGVVDDLRWLAYLTHVYGEFALAPTEVLDLDEFDLFYLHWLAAAGIDIWAYELASDDCCVSLGFIHTPNTTLFRRLNPVRRPYASVHAHTPIEVMHCFHADYERGYWIYMARGSGVWLNTGATIVFNDHDQANAVALESWSAPARGLGSPMLNFMQRHRFDSYQFRRAEFACAPHEIVFAAGRGNEVCGGAPLRAGFRAEREHRCDSSRRCIRQDQDSPTEIYAQEHRRAGRIWKRRNHSHGIEKAQLRQSRKLRRATHANYTTSTKSQRAQGTPR